MRGRHSKFFVFLASFILVLANFYFRFPIPQAKADATTWYANSSAADGGTGTAGSPFNTFTAAYNAASSGDTIDLTGTFDWSTAGETGDASVTGYTIAKSLTIQGQTATSTFIQAASTPYAADSRIFTINSGNTVTIQRLTLRYGYRNADNWSGTALSSAATLTILSSIITENANPARFGGAAINFSGASKFVMRNSTLHNNGKTDGYWPGYTAGVDGGGSNAGNEITNCTFTNNRAGYNGGIYISTGNLTITNSTFVYNYAATTSADAGIWGGRFYLKNNIFADSTGDVNVTVGGSGAITDNGYNIVERQENAGFVNGVNGNLVGDQANLNISHTLEDNNTLYDTSTLALSADSVAINAADPADGANNGISIPTEDQRGAARPDATDIGAYEYGGLIDIAEPTIQASNTVISGLSYDKATVSWSNGNGSRRAVFLKNTSSGIASPVDGSNYSADTVFGSGSQISSSGWYCVYNGTGTSVDVTGLLSEHNYLAQVFEYNGTIVGTQNYLTTSAVDNPKSFTTSTVGTPETQASEITFSSVGATSVTASWTDGGGVSRAAFLKAGASGTATPVNLTTYTASTTFGSGAQIDTSGWYCVYNGSGSSVTISGLSLSTSYRLQIFEYNGGTGDEHYLTSSATNNPKNQATTSRPDGEDFETGSFSNFEWTSGGTATSYQWTVTSADKNAGTYSAKAGAYNEASKTSYLQVTLDVLEAGNISFYKKVSSESGYDYFRFYIDGVQPASSSWSGSVAWSQSTYAVTTGEHTFKWQYSKDGSVNSGSDTAWIDDIVFPKINPTTYSLEYIAGSHGTISGNEYQVVNEGEDGSEVEAIADTGYHFVSWDDLLSDNPRTDTGVTESISVTANFAVNTYTLSYGTSAPGPGSATGHGTISGSSSQTVSYGGSGTAITAVADSGYQFVRWSDGSTNNPRIDTNVADNITVSAVFETQSTNSTSSTSTTGSAGSSNKTVSTSKSIQALSGQADLENEIQKDQIETVTGTNQSYYAKAYEKDGQILLSEIRFRILDRAGNPLVGVKVYLHSEVREATTDENGIAIFKDVPSGDHSLEVAYSGKTLAKKVVISEPADKDKEIELQTIEIRVEDPPSLVGVCADYYRSGRYFILTG